MRFGCVSWIRPGTYYENAVLIAKHVDFIELLVYTWDEGVRHLLLKELDGLKSLKVFYTVHLPTDDIQNCRLVYEFFLEHTFPIRNYVLHPLDGWLDFIRNRPDVTLENLIESNEVYKSMTLDIGHLMLSSNGEKVLTSPVIEEIEEFHIHGVDGGKDHELLDENSINYLATLTGKYKIVQKSLNNDDVMINFEIFNYNKFRTSIKRFKNAFLYNCADR
jgi:hypothetical protein